MSFIYAMARGGAMILKYAALRCPARELFYGADTMQRAR